MHKHRNDINMVGKRDTGVKHDHELLNGLLEYCRHLYEEEKYRKDSLNSAVKIYLAFLTFFLGFASYKAIPLKEFSLALREHGGSIENVVALTLYLVSVISFCASVVFTVRVLKIWKFERLTDPKVTVIKSMHIGNRNDLLMSVISDYAVACNRNYIVNENKASLLSRALFFLVLGFILMVISLFLINGLILLNGGHNV